MSIRPQTAEKHPLLLRFLDLKMLYSLRSQVGDLPISNTRVELEKSISDALGIVYDPADAEYKIRQIAELNTILLEKSNRLVDIQQQIDEADLRLLEIRTEVRLEEDLWDLCHSKRTGQTPLIAAGRSSDNDGPHPKGEKTCY